MHSALIFFLFNLTAATESFDARVAVANAAEKDPAFASYQEQMFAPIGSDLAALMSECYDSLTLPSNDDFTLVSELDREGRPTDVAVQPETNLAKCLSERFVSLRFSPPPPHPGRTGFPIVLEMHIHPQAPPDAP